MLVLPPVILGYAFMIAFNNVEGLRGPCSLDAAVTWVGDNEIYLFKGNKYGRWNQTSKRVEGIGYIAQNWHGIPNDLEAASTYLNSNSFFKGCQYWLYYEDGRSIGPGDAAPRICNLEAAAANGSSIYFFYENYYRKQTTRGDLSIARWINWNWGKLEGNIDAAVQANTGEIYFFKENKYWRFEKNGIKATVGYVAEDWGNLLDSELLPDCRCNCSICSNANCELHSIKYQTDQAKISYPPSDVIGRQKVEKRNREVPRMQTVTFTVSKSVTETESFTHTSGVPVTEGTEFETGIPVVNDAGEASTEITACRKYEYGRQRSVQRTREATFECDGVWTKTSMCTVKLYYRKVDIPYTMVWKHKSKGCNCESKGIFTSVWSTNMRMENKWI